MHQIQQKLLKKIDENKKLGSLTLRDIGKLIGEKAPQKIKHHLSQLEKNGFINLNKKNKKIIRIKGGRLKKTSSIIAVPILGYADCGEAKQIAEEIPEGFLKISSKLLSATKNIFAIQAIGSSMNRAKIGKDNKSIEEGDFVIIDYDDKIPKNGEYFLSIIDGMANLKKVLIDNINKQLVLMSESTLDYKPIFIHLSDDHIIGGKIVQIIKKPKIN